MNKVESALQRTTDTKALVIGVGTLPRTAEMFNELFPGCRAVVVRGIAYVHARGHVNLFGVSPVR